MLFRYRLLFAMVIYCMMAAAPAFAQDAQVSGRVTDPSGAVIANARIDVRNQATSASRSTTTNGDGQYVVPFLNPGTYAITADADGFKRFERTDVRLNAAQHVTVDIVVEVGGARETVTVSGGVSLLNTTNAAVATVVDRRFVENLPMNGRSFQSLLTLTPGVVTVASSNAINTAGQLSVNGQRSSANNFMVDGVSANIGAAPGSFNGAGPSGNLPGMTTLGTTQSLASIDALQEFKVQTSTYSAEYGRQPGGQISIVTRSGTNEFHGSIFDYVRNDAFDANDWFAARAGQPKPPERQQDFGATLGGPLALPGIYDGRNQTFFFVSYEGLRLRLPQFTVSNVPTLALRQQAPAGVQPILNAYPLPNGRDLGNGLAEFSAGYSEPSKLDATSVRVDHTAGSRMTFFARYNKVPSRTETRVPSDLAQFYSNRLNATSITAGSTMAFGARASNDLRVNYSDNRATTQIVTDSLGGATPIAREVLIPSVYDTPSAQALVEFRAWPGSTANASLALSGTLLTTQRQVNIVDNFSFSFGTHQFKAGMDYRRLTPVVDINTYNIRTSFPSQTDVLNGRANSGTVSATVRMRPVFTNVSAYLQDTWRVSRRLTLDLGARWDVNPAPTEATGKVPPALTQIDDLATLQLAPQGTPQWRTTYHNLAPRIGAAYRLSEASGRETVLRGGVGLFYDTGNDNASSSFNDQYPYSATRTLSGVTYPLSPANVAPTPLPAQAGLTPPYPVLLVFDPNLELPYTWQWNVAVERALGETQSLTVSYVGADGQRLLQRHPRNIASVNPAFTRIILTRNQATSSYNALQAQYQRRLSHGWQALTSYTWGHAIDEDSRSDGARVAQRGNADFDVRHVVAAATTYDIPAPWRAPVLRALLGDWSIDTSLHAQSAPPIDIVAGSFISADGATTGIRPNVVPGAPVYIDDPTLPGGRRINAAAFAVPPAGQSGDLGRNQIRGLPAWQVDAALRRQFRLTHGVRLQVRAEGFNIFNHPNFGTIQTTLSAANFGQATNMLNRQLGGLNQLYQMGGPRSFQFAVKVLF